MQRRDIQVDAIMDIETADWDEFVMGGVYLEKYDEVSISDWKHEDCFVDSLLRLKGEKRRNGKPGPANVWAHNGGKFDWKWFLDHVYKREIAAQLFASGGRIVVCEIPAGQKQCPYGLKLLDSYALVPMSLKRFTAGQGIEKEQLELTCKCGRECGGYCRINRKMTAKDLRVLAKYLTADLMSLGEALKNLRRFALHNDLDLGATVGSSAWRTASRWLELPNAEYTESQHFYARRSYYGGRCHVGATESPAGFRYDVNSMYPASLMRAELPVGPHEFMSAPNARSAYRDSLPGIYSATVHMPDGLNLAPLPIRTKTRIYYPVGKFSGVWTQPELAYAERFGEVRVQGGMVWGDSDRLFPRFVESLFSLRASAPGGKKSPLGEWLKFYLNSLTGKLAVKPYKSRILLHPTRAMLVRAIEESLPSETHVCHVCGEKGLACLDDCSGRRGPRPLGRPGDDSIWSVPILSLDPCGHIPWAAYLTATSRVEWHTMATSVGDGSDVVYGDTDSVFCEKVRNHQIGDACGQWSYEGEYLDLKVLAPKVYHLLKLGEDIRSFQAKGVRPESANDLVVGMDGRTQPIPTGVRIVGVRAGARNQKFFQKADQTRILEVGYGDRVLMFDGIHTRPSHISEVAE